jgi:lipopolysaccharide/colanic/teichoic acid biosynthesis glycosyltransferase
MLNLRDASGMLLPDEQRLSAFGKLLRHTSMDELPGFWNVIRGDLSLIGPRPLPVEYTQFYSAKQAERLNIKPGMAGYAALFGRNAQPWEAIFERDVWYSRSVSFALDLKIIFGVVRLVPSRKGIDRGDHDVASPFADTLKKNLSTPNPGGEGMREGAP